MTAITFDGVRLAIDYTDRDFLSIVVTSRQLVTDRFPQITDFNTASQVEMIIELFASVFDRLMFMQDKHAGETNIITARRRRNVINLALSIGYIPSTAKAATGVIKATLPNGAIANNVLIERNTIITTKESSNPVSFRTTADILITAGNTSETGPIKNSLEHDFSDTSNAAPNQEFVLDEIPFLDDTSIVVLVSAVQWEQVDTFLDSTSLSEHYIVRVDDVDRATVIFGDSINGKIPIGSIEITYETGGGSAGNQAENTITENSDEFDDVLGNDVRVTFTNEAATVDGDEREDTEEIRFRAPRNLSAPTRTITRKDFQVNVEDGVTGVVRAIGFSSDQDVAIPENHVYVYIVPLDMSPYTATMANSYVGLIANGAAIDNGDTSVVLDTVGGISPGNDILLDDGSNSTTVTVLTVTPISNTITFNPIAGLPAAIADGADATKAITDLVNGDESLIVDDLAGLFVGSILLIDDSVNPTVSVTVTEIETLNNAIRFSPVSLGSSIVDGAAIERTNNGEASPALKDSVETFLTTVFPDGKPIPLTMDLSIFTAPYLVVQVKGQVYIDPDVEFSVAQGLVEDNLNNFFDYGNRQPDSPFDYTIDFGKTVRWSPVVDEIQKVNGVNHIQGFEINTQGIGGDLPLTEKQIPAFDNSNFGVVFASGGLEFLVDS